MNVIRVNFQTGDHSTELDDFDLELEAALKAIPRCKTKRDEDNLNAHVKQLLDRAERKLKAVGL